MPVRTRGLTVTIDGDTTGLTKALQNVNKEVRNTQSQLKDVDKLLRLDPSNTELLSQKQRMLGDAVNQTRTKLDTLKTASDQANTSLANGEITQEQYDALQREIAETEQSLRSLEEEYRNFGSVQAQEVAAAGEKMKDLGGKLEGAGKTMTTHVTLPLAAVGAAGAASFAEVDKTMQLTNKTMGNTEQQAQMLNRAMKDAASNSTYGMKDAANATLNFARAGLNAEQAAAALAPAMNLAAGEGGNLDTVSGGLVATINGFHGSFEEAGTYADVFAAACNNSALDVDSLSHAMSVAAPIFSSAGYTVNDAALYMGVMANNGIEADKAANSLKTGIARLVSPAKEGAAMMEQLGISVTNADGSMKDSVTIQKELHDAFANLSESEQIAAASAIFGKNQMAPWLALINTAPSDVNELDASLRNCAGTTDEMAEAMMSGFGGSLEKLKSSIDVLVTSIGEALAPTIMRVAEAIQNLVDKFNALSPAQQQLIVNIGLVVAAVGPVLVIVGKLMSSIGTIMTWAPKIANLCTTAAGWGPKIVSAISVVKGALSSLWAFMLANPITIIIAAVAALAAAFIYLWNNCEGFRQFWINLWENIKLAVTTAVEAIGAFLTAAWETITAAFQTAWTAISGFFSGIWQGLQEVVASVTEAISAAITAAWTAIYEFFEPLLTGLQYLFETIWQAIQILIGMALDAIRQKIQEIWNAIVAFLTPLLEGIRNTVQTVWNAIKTVITTALNGIKSIVTTVWNSIKSVVTTVLEAIKSVVTAAWNNIRNVITTAMNAIRSTVQAMWNNVKSAIQATISQIVSVIQSGFNNAVNFIRGLAGQAYSWGRDLIMGIVNGIRSAIGAIGDACRSVADAIRSFLHFSVPDVGPLTDYESWMPDFMKGLAKGIEKSRGLVADAMEGVAGTMNLSPVLNAAGSGAMTARRTDMGLLTQLMDAVSGLDTNNGGDITIPVYIGQDRIDEIVVTAAQRAAFRSGGR